MISRNMRYTNHKEARHDLQNNDRNGVRVGGAGVPLTYSVRRYTDVQVFKLFPPRFCNIYAAHFRFVLETAPENSCVNSSADIGRPK